MLTLRRGGSSALNSSSVTSVGTTCRGIKILVRTFRAPFTSPAKHIWRKTPGEIKPSSMRLASPVSTYRSRFLFARPRSGRDAGAVTRESLVRPVRFAVLVDERSPVEALKQPARRATVKVHARQNPDGARDSALACHLPELVRADQIAQLLRHLLRGQHAAQQTAPGLRRHAANVPRETVSRRTAPA